LEKEPINESKIIFEHKPQNAFFQKLMHGSSFYLVSLKALEKFINAKPLLRKLFFQMDNCVKNNKDRRLHFYLS